MVKRRPPVPSLGGRAHLSVTEPASPAVPPANLGKVHHLDHHGRQASPATVVFLSAIASLALPVVLGMRGSPAAPLLPGGLRMGDAPATGPLQGGLSVGGAVLPTDLGMCGRVSSMAGVGSLPARLAAAALAVTGEGAVTALRRTVPLGAASVEWQPARLASLSHGAVASRAARAARATLASPPPATKCASQDKSHTPQRVCCTKAGSEQPPQMLPGPTRTPEQRAPGEGVTYRGAGALGHDRVMASPGRKG